MNLTLILGLGPHSPPCTPPMQPQDWFSSPKLQPSRTSTRPQGSKVPIGVLLGASRWFGRWWGCKNGVCKIQAWVANRKSVAIRAILTGFLSQLLQQIRSYHLQDLYIWSCKLEGSYTDPWCEIRLSKNHDKKARRNGGLLLCCGSSTPNVLTPQHR